MLDIKTIRENPEAVKQAAAEKGYKVDIDRLLRVDEKRRELLLKVEEIRTKQNKISKGQKGKPSKEEISASKELKAKLEKIEPDLTALEKDFNELMLQVPSIPFNKSPKGGEEANKEIRKEGKPKKFNFDIKDHAELAENLNLLDVERGVKIGGTRSYILKNELVILEQALLRYALDTVRKEGFEVMNVPVVVREDVLLGSGFFPFAKDDIYKVDDSYLVGTSEASLVYFYAGETISKESLPKLLSGITTCFRREVGTYGKDNRGFFRVHQFNKVEQVVLCKGENWEKMFNFILGISERIVKSLNIAYRIIEIATGDMGAKNIRQNDIEVWFPAQKKYRETHSCSYLGDFQARRANIKYRDEKGNKEYVHTLNNTAIATPRILGAILETYQQKDGSILIPETLHKYTGFKEIR